MLPVASVFLPLPSWERAGGEGSLLTHKFKLSPCFSPSPLVGEGRGEGGTINPQGSTPRQPPVTKFHAEV